MKIIVLKTSAIFLTLFGLITVFMSGSVIFDLFGIREKEGNYVLFIVVSNFICGFLYLASAYGLFIRKKWATHLLMTSLAILSLSFAGFMWYINMGGIYEQQTIKAMLFRIVLTFLFTGISWHYISKEKINQQQIKTKTI